MIEKCNMFELFVYSITEYFYAKFYTLDQYHYVILNVIVIKLIKDNIYI